MFKDYEKLNNAIEEVEEEIIKLVNEIKEIDVDNLMDEGEYEKCKSLAFKLEAKFSLHGWLVQEIIE